MAVLFGALLSYGKLSADNEITALKAAGLGYKTLATPIIFFACGLSLFLIFFNHFLAPELNSHLKVYFQEVAKTKPLARFDEKSLKTIGNYNIYSNKVNNATNTLIGVSIYKFENHNPNPKNVLPQNDNGAWRITASSATVKTYSNGVKMTLHNGYWQKASPSDMTNMTHSTFKTYSFLIPIENNISSDGSHPSQIPSPKLLKTVKQYKKQKLDFIPYLLDYWIRWVFALAPLVFIFIALPIGIRTGKEGKAAGFGLSLVIVVIYYVLFTLAANIGEKKYLPMGIILWLPDLVIGSLGIYLFNKMVKR
jgi:lipopolysaccharide export system permease protein